MSKVENPYLKVQSNIDESLQLHKLEYNRMTRNVLETELEMKVEMLANHPLVAEIKSQPKLSEEDQVILDTNAFSLNYQRQKLEFFKSYEKENKKFADAVKQLKNMISDAQDKLAMNESILSKFTDEEIKKDPKLKKMTSYVPNGYETALAKFNELDISLSKLYTDFICKNNEDLAEKLLDFLDEAKNVRVQLANMIARKMKPEEVIQHIKVPDAEVSEETAPKETAPRDIFGDTRSNYEFIKNMINESNDVGEQELEELKTYLGKALTADQLGDYNKFEQEVITEYERINATNGIIAKRLEISIGEFRKGVNKIKEFESGSSNLGEFNVKTRKFLEEEVLAKGEDIIKHDPAFINKLIGYCAAINKIVIKNNSTQTKKFLFIKGSATPELETLKKIHYTLSTFLREKIGCEPSLLTNDLEGTLYTEDKLDELGYALMNNASNITNTNSTGDWKSSVNRLLVNCIFEMIAAVEANKNPEEVLERYKVQYGPKEEEVIEETTEVNKGQTQSTRVTTYFKKNSDNSVVKKMIQ